MFKFNKKLLPPRFTHYYQPVSNIHTYNTRQSAGSLYTPRIHKLSGQRSLQFGGVKIWNDIPNEIKTKRSMKSFSNALKNLYIQSYGK